MVFTWWRASGKGKKERLTEITTQKTCESEHVSVEAKDLRAIMPPMVEKDAPKSTTFGGHPARRQSVYARVETDSQVQKFLKVFDGRILGVQDLAAHRLAGFGFAHTRRVA